MKTLRSCRSRSNRQFLEEGLRRLVTPVAAPIPEGIAVSATTLGACDPGDPDEVDSDVAFIGGVVRAMLESIPQGLTCSILSHILVGHHGTIVDAVVGHYHLAQHGMLRAPGYARVKELVRQAGGAHPDLLLKDQRIALRREQLGDRANGIRW